MLGVTEPKAVGSINQKVSISHSSFLLIFPTKVVPGVVKFWCIFSHCFRLLLLFTVVRGF